MVENIKQNMLHLTLNEQRSMGCVDVEDKI